MFQTLTNALMLVIVAVAVISAGDEMQRQNMILAPAKFQVNIPVTYSARHHGVYVTGYGASNAHGWYGQGVRAAVRPLPSPSHVGQRYVSRGYGVPHSAPIFRWDATRPRTKGGQVRHHGHYGKGRCQAKGGHRGEPGQVIRVVHPGYAKPTSGYGYRAPTGPYTQTPYTPVTPAVAVAVAEVAAAAPDSAEVVPVAPVVEQGVAVEPVVEPVVEAAVAPAVEEVGAPVVEAVIAAVVPPVITAVYRPVYKTAVTVAPVEVPALVASSPVLPELIVPTPTVAEVVASIVDEVVAAGTSCRTSRSRKGRRNGPHSC